MRPQAVADSVARTRAELDMHELPRDDGFVESIPVRLLWLRVTGATPIADTDNRFQYTAIEVTYRTAGTWADRSGGFNGTAYVGPEGLNDANTVGASNEDPENDWPAAVTLRPLGPGPHLAVLQVDCVSGAEHAIIVSPNNPGGSCQGAS